MSRFTECALCGASGREPEDIAVGLAWWLDPVDPRRPIGAVPRCRDHVACRQRVEAAGEDWPLKARAS